MPSNILPIDGPDGDRLVAALYTARAAVRPRRDAYAPSEPPPDEWWAALLHDPRLRLRKRDWGGEPDARPTLGDYAAGRQLAIVCYRCYLRRDLDVAALIGQHGADAPLPSPIDMVSDCPRAIRREYRDWCGARYEF